MHQRLAHVAGQDLIVDRPVFSASSQKTSWWSQVQRHAVLAQTPIRVFVRLFGYSTPYVALYHILPSKGFVNLSKGDTSWSPPTCPVRWKARTWPRIEL
jgi:hypothetical protein